MAFQGALRSAQSKTPSLRTVAMRTLHTKTPSLRTIARNKTTMRVVGSRSSAEDPDALVARLAAQLAPEVAPTRSMAAVVVASPCSVATVTQHLVDELQLDAAVGFGSHREAFCEACDGANPRAAVTLLAMPDGATAQAFASDAGCLPALEDWERFVATSCRRRRHYYSSPRPGAPPSATSSTSGLGEWTACCRSRPRWAVW